MAPSLLLLAGDVECNPGPPRLPPTPRGPLDLESGFTSTTALRMRKCFAAFRLWLADEAQLPFASVAASGASLALALRAYGLHLYSSGLPRYLLVYAITSAQDRFPEFKPCFGPAWQIDHKWQAVEPGECRPVVSVPIIQSLVTVGLLWDWASFVAITLVGFLCMLHPSEFLVLRRADLILPSDAMVRDRVAYIHLRNPKTARFARRQHCRLEDRSVLAFLAGLYEGWPPDRPLYPGSANTYRTQWNAVMRKLGVPCTRATKGATPGVLRGSGATYLYLETEDIGKVQWRGRWARLKTVEFYLQEVGAQLLLARLPAASRERIRFL